MAKSDKEAPQTIKQRQATLKAKRREDGYIEMAVWVKTDTRDQLKAQANEQGVTIGQRIDQLINS
jgi:hypothetical protein